MRIIESNYRGHSCASTIARILLFKFILIFENESVLLTALMTLGSNNKNLSRRISRWRFRSTMPFFSIRSLVVSKMKSEHERELMIVEKMKQQEVDQVTRAFDQTRSVRDLTNRIFSLGEWSSSSPSDQLNSARDCRNFEKFQH